MMNKLNDIPDKNPFKVPENYFKEVNRKIISETTGFDREVKKIGLYNRFKPIFLVAASVSFIIIGYTTVKLLYPDSKKSNMSEIINEEIPDFYVNDIDMFTLEENAADIVFYDEGPDVDKEDIIDYLLMENIEINDIYEQL